ncbi:midnolin-A isoform X2 [Prorops nasuta]|uniref:midnolin-A isoform X2 n=1 Tax=Prorops nasuta TaxID=863751 RepID=UPI0034CE6C7D
MDDSTELPSDVTALGSENQEQKVHRDAEDSSGSTTTFPSKTTAVAAAPLTGNGNSAGVTTSMENEYRAQPPRMSPASPIPVASALTSSSTGCGCGAVSTLLEPDLITVNITPTTGGQFDLTVERSDTVENLKKIISKRLKVAKERICLLYRERQLREGTLEENRLQDGSRLTLLPSVETGLLAQRPEQSVMQALESLNDSQVNDFLSGKAPLNLTMRLGDHMMLIQLQLSTVTPASPGTSQTHSNTGGSSTSSLNLAGNGSSNGNNSSNTATTNTSNGVGGTNTTNSNGVTSNHVLSSLQSRQPTVLSRTVNSAFRKLQKRNMRALKTSLYNTMASAFQAVASCGTNLTTATTTTTSASPVCGNESSTTPSSSPISSTHSPTSPPHSPFCQSQQAQSTPGSSNGGPDSPGSAGNSPTAGAPYPPLSHHHHYYHHYHRHHHHHRSRNKQPNTPDAPNSADQQQSTSSVSLESTSSYDNLSPRKKFCSAHHYQQQTSGDMGKSIDGDSTSHGSPGTSLIDQSKTPTLDTRALAEASRNLTQKLKQLSSEENARRRQGAIIESMHHHGKGVYSGTFSGTLNPALQDRHGRPKRDISTIIHILNDLLCATPAATAGHYRHHHRHANNRQVSLASADNAAESSSNLSGPHDSSSTSGCTTEELSKENEATKGKMRRLRLVMEQRRAKRKARRQARAAPYTTQWAAVTPDPGPNHDSGTSTSTSANSTNAAEPQTETELQPCSPEPVVA